MYFQLSVGKTIIPNMKNRENKIMKRLTCEMCGSTDLLKQDGVFVCQTCGTKYSVEEAKKMMIEGTVDVSGSTVKVDNTDSIDTYMSMAENAYNANNLREAESYCNKVIEIDPDNYDAWMIKGQASGWQSSLANIRLEEAVNCFINAIRLAPEEPQPIKLDLMGTEVDATVDIRQRIIDKSTEEIQNISVAIVKLQGDNFAKWPDTEEASGLLNVVKLIYQIVIVYLNTIQTPIDISTGIATTINNSVMTAWNNIVVPDYVNDDDTGHPSDYAFDNLLKRAGNCATLLEYAISLSDDDYDSNIIRYNNLIAIHERCISSCSYKSEYFNYEQLVRYDDDRYWRSQHIQQAIKIVEQHGGIPDVNNNRFWAKNKTLTTSAISERRALIAKYRSEISKCQNKIHERNRREEEEKRKRQEEERRKKEQEQRERNEAYWATHAEKKSELESERNNLQIELTQLENQIAPADKEIANLKKQRDAEVPSKETKRNVEKQISDLFEQQSHLGIFKGKEKKALQAQIDELDSRLTTINESIAAEKAEQEKNCNARIREIEDSMKPIKEKIASINSRIAEINTELTKNR